MVKYEMKNALIIVGKEIKLNYTFFSYLKREVTNAIGLLDVTLFIANNDERISQIIKDTTDSYENIVIATTNSFELVGKILSTKTSDTLVYKQNMLIPAKASIVEESSYMLKNVNVIHVDVRKKIPKILIEAKPDMELFIFCDDKEVKRFEKLAHIFKVESLGVEIIDGVWKYSLSTQNEIGIQRLLEEFREMVTHKILIGDNLFSIIAKILIEKNLSISFAESCTGGLMASELTKNSGVSSIFKGSIVSYANEIKSKMVGVKEDTLKRYGAVSKETVDEMLFGVIKKFDADFAIAVSGVAGPDGGSREKPVGTVYIGTKNRENQSNIKKLSLKGDRIYVQQITIFWALKLLVSSNEQLFFKFMPKSLDK